MISVYKNTVCLSENPSRSESESEGKVCKKQRDV